MVAAYPGSSPHRKFAIFLGLQEALIIRLISYPWANNQFQNWPFHIDGKRESSVCTEIVLCGVNSGHICQHICIRVIPSTLHVHGCPLRLSAHIKLASTESRTPARNKRSNTLRSYPFPCPCAPMPPCLSTALCCMRPNVHSPFLKLVRYVEAHDVSKKLRAIPPVDGAHYLSP
jgi:hypothetical protein